MANSKQPRPPYQHSFRNVPVGHKLLLLLAAVSMLMGAGLWAARAIEPGAQSRAESRAGVMGAGRAAADSQPAVADDDWSPAMFKLGGSFLIGFCVGYALRAFFKASVLALGLVFLGMFALNHYATEPVINWPAVSGLMEQLMAKVQSEMGGFKTFIEGSLPSASLACLGLYMGFRKH